MVKFQTSHGGESASTFFKGTLKHADACMLSELQLIWDILLRTIVAITLVSRGYLILKWGSNLRGVLWNEELISPIVEDWFGLTWLAYIEHSDPAITLGTQVLGGTLIIFGILTCSLNKNCRVILCTTLVFSTLLLALVSWSDFHDTHGQLGVMFENALQVFCPVLLFIRLVAPASMRLWGMLACTLSFFCFAGHGLYAVGYYPVPPGFVNMVMAILPLEESLALNFLRIAGCLDFVVALFVLCFAPLRRFGLLYMIVWGFLTALARPLVYCDAALDCYGLDRWGIEFLVRCSHYMVPFLILLLLPGRNDKGRLNLQLMKLGSVTQRIVART